MLVLIQLYLVSLFYTFHYSLLLLVVLLAVLVILLPAYYLIEDHFIFFEYEFSGEKVRIKRSFFLWKKEIESIEFPKSKLIGFELEETLSITGLKLELELVGKVKQVHYFPIIGFNEQNVELLESSLQEIMGYRLISKKGL